MTVASAIVFLLAAILLRSQSVRSNVIVDRTRDEYAVEPPPARAPSPLQDGTSTNPYEKKLLDLYFLVQVVRSYRRLAHEESAGSDPFERLASADLRDELERLLVGVDGFEEIFNLGQYAERDPLKERLANDVRMLLPLVVRKLSELQASGTADGAEMGEALHSKIRQAVDEFRTRMSSAVSLGSDVLEDIERKHPRHEASAVEGRTDHGMAMDGGIDAGSETYTVNDLPEEVPAIGSDKKESALKQAVENTLQFQPNDKDARHELSLTYQDPEPSLGRDVDEENNRTEVIELIRHENSEQQSASSLSHEANLPGAVSAKDPEVAALIPFIVEQLRMGNVSSDEEETLAEIFGQDWPSLRAGAGRLE